MASIRRDIDPHDLEDEDDVLERQSADIPPAKVDIPRIERAVREILIAVGEDPDREGLLKTPNRVARAYGELMAGLQDDPRRHLKTVFNERYDEIVLLRDSSTVCANITCCRSPAGPMSPIFPTVRLLA